MTTKVLKSRLTQHGGSLRAVLRLGVRLGWGWYNGYGCLIVLPMETARQIVQYVAEAPARYRTHDVCYTYIEIPNPVFCYCFVLPAFEVSTEKVDTSSTMFC